MNELREEIGVQMSLTGRCRVRWAGHLVRMGKERMTESGQVEGARQEDASPFSNNWAIFHK